MNKKCESCNGSGQISFFQGVSRFLITVEECHECAGLGYIISSDSDSQKQTLSSHKKNKNNIKKK